MMIIMKLTPVPSNYSAVYSAEKERPGTAWLVSETSVGFGLGLRYQLSNFPTFQLSNIHISMTFMIHPSLAFLLPAPPSVWVKF